ncbi:MAG: hypothetical protein A2045_16745 [Rhodocyclales bacterium GWA2_65_20]|nr:MAG: hypothetical protein A2045_16745 [Rhodocyclales bacterium GWA2_65_20]
MRSFRLLAVLLSGLAVAVPAAAQSHDHHENHGAASAELRLDDGGRKWPTDAPLRKNMNAMRADLGAKLHAIHGGKLGKADYAKLGQTIEARIGDIVSQCKLDTKADAMLHIVIAELIQAADVMLGKAEGDPAAAAHQAALALNGYGKHFNHPAWKPLQ